MNKYKSIIIGGASFIGAILLTLLLSNLLSDKTESGENKEVVSANEVEVELEIDIDDPIKDGKHKIIDKQALQKETKSDYTTIKDEDVVLAPLKVDEKSVLRAPAIGVVFNNFGLNQENSKEAIDNDLIHKNSCLALNPYTKIRTNISIYDKVISIPFEPFEYPRSDPGPKTILTGMSKKETFKRFNYFLRKAENISGFTPIMGEKFFSSIKDTAHLFEEIKKRYGNNIVFINNSPNIKSIATVVANKFKVLNINIDFNIERLAVFRSVNSVLSDAREMALKTGFVIIAVNVNNHRHLKYVKNWITKLRTEGFRTISPIKLCLLNSKNMIDGPYIVKNFYKKNQD